MIGIYKITNILNNKCYVGQSNNIERRFKEHCYKGSTSKIPLDIAIAKYGRENFILEVLEECELDELNKKESFWIHKLDTINNGYNCNPGGDSAQTGSNNSNHKLAESDIKLIREAYNSHLKQKDVYEKFFSNRISFGYFQNIWQGKSWSHIMPEVFTLENKEYYIYQNSLGGNGSSGVLSDDEVNIIRQRYVNETAKQIYEDYKDRIKFQTFQGILWGRHYKHLPIYSKKTKKWINK